MFRSIKRAVSGAVKWTMYTVAFLVWETADAFEKWPQSLPEDMPKRRKIGVIGGVTSLALFSAEIFWLAGPLTAVQMALVAYLSLVVGVTPVVLGYGRGFSTACARAQIAAREEKRQRLEGSRPLLPR